MATLAELLAALSAKPGVIRHKLVSARDAGLVKTFKFIQTTPSGTVREVFMDISVSDEAGNNAVAFNPTALDQPAIDFIDSAKAAFALWVADKNPIEAWEFIRGSNDSKYAIFMIYWFDSATDTVEQKMKIATQGATKIQIRDYKWTETEKEFLRRKAQMMLAL